MRRIFSGFKFPIAFGSYTPTITNSTNVLGSTPRLAFWIRLGNLVFVFLQCDIDPSLAAPTISKIIISLPIPSTLTNVHDLAGIGASQGVVAGTQAGALYADTTPNNRAVYDFTATNVASLTHCLAFAYPIYQ